MSRERDALDRFGALLIRRVRDEAICDWDMVLDGRFNDDESRRVREAVASFSPEQLSVLRRLVPKIVDTALHHLLWTLDQSEWVDVVVRSDGEADVSVRDASDGLAG